MKSLFPLRGIRFMRNPNTIQLYQYWLSLRSAATTPTAGDCRSRKTREILPNLFILDGATPASASFCFSGFQLNRLYDRDLEGSRFIDLFRALDRDSILSAIKVASTLKLPMLIGSVAPCQNDRYMHFEILLLPPRKSFNLCGSIVQVAETRWIKAPLDEMQVVSTRILHAELEAPRREAAKTPPTPAMRPTFILYDGLKRG